MEEEVLDLQELGEKTLSAIKEKRVKDLREIFETIPTIDIAESLEDVEDVGILLYVFRVISPEYTGEFFTDLKTEQQELIVKSLSDKDLIKLIENQFADDIVDTLEEFPANLVNKVLRVAPADIRKEINQLLNYKDNTAGSLMTTEYIELVNTLTVKDAIAEIRKNGREAETVYTVFVRDRKRTLVGTISLDDLIFAKEDETLDDIMDRDFVTCNVNDDQEEVANMFKRYDLTAMAVVNSEDKIIGLVTIDDVVDVLVEEANEDVNLLNQVSSMDKPYLDTPVFSIVLKCVPWILVLIVLQMFSTLIISKFEGAIASLTLLSFFMSLVTDAGGNAGGQTTTLIVRSISLGEFDKGDFKRVLWKEFRVALCIAGIVSAFAFAWIFFETSVGIANVAESIQGVKENLGIELTDWAVKLVVSGLIAATLFVAMIVSRMVACMLPFLAKAIKLDPAVVCGPFTTTLVDVITLLTYFLLWTFVFGPMLGI